MNSIICICGPDRIGNGKIIEALFSLFPIYTFSSSVTQICKEKFIGKETEVDLIARDLERQNLKFIQSKSPFLPLIIQPHMESWKLLDVQFGPMFNVFISATNLLIENNFRDKFGDAFPDEIVQEYFERARGQWELYLPHRPRFHCEQDANDQHVAIKIAIAIEKVFSTVKRLESSKVQQSSM